MATKYVFVTGGVVSGLGKGITAASLGRLLKTRGLKVASQKLDPYINVDPGTMSPLQHGEVFVTDDGTETDLDLGHYERFIDENLNKYSNLTTGKVYWNVLNKERQGAYLGQTVQIIPHITNEIKSYIYNLAKSTEADVVITEIGGTTGDIESQPFLEAIRQVGIEQGMENCCYIHVVLVPYISGSDEYKSKPAQHSCKELQGMGIAPNVIVLRADGRVGSDIKRKISMFCNVRPDCVIENLTGFTKCGGLGTYLSAADMQIARGEPIQDTARVLGRYYDAIVYRTFKQSDVDALARYSGVPVVSGMTDYAHPLQVLTDLMTVREYKGKLAGLKAGFVGDGYNMANSLIVGCLMMGMDFTIACPNGYRPSADVLFFAREYGDHFKLTTAPDEAARGADVLFTDVWTSMGMERETERRRRDFNGFCLDAARMALAKPDCIVQHPLPAHRGEEITPDVFETHADEIFDEAENRLHVEKAVLGILLAGK